METHRISIDIDHENHRKLKIYCASLGITIKKFILNSILKEIQRSKNVNNE